MDTGGDEIVRGNVCTMVPGEDVPYGADWHAVLCGDRLVMHATHRDGTVYREVFTDPIEVSALRRVIALVRPRCDAVPARLRAAAD